MIVEAGKCLQGQIFRMDLVGSGLDRVGAGVVWMRGGDACIALLGSLLAPDFGQNLRR